MNERLLESKVAVVTGAARGIGKMTALRLANEGCRVVLSGRNAAVLDAVAREIQEAHGEAVSVVGDLCEADVPQRLIEQARSRFGRVDILVNSAGVAKHAPFLEIDLADWQRMLDLQIDRYVSLRTGGRASDGRGEAGREHCQPVFDRGLDGDVWHRHVCGGQGRCFFADAGDGGGSCTLWNHGERCCAGAGCDGAVSRRQ